MSKERLKIWVMASRPKTLPAAAAPVIIGTAMARGADSFHLLSVLAALLGALLIQVGTNFANDYFDHKKGTDSGNRLGPTRVTQAGLVAPSTMKRAIWLVFALALICGTYLVWRGGWPIVLIGLSSILFGILYTAGPYPLGYNGLGEIFVLIFFGPVAVGGTYYVSSLTITPEVLFAGLAPGLFSVAILIVNNLRDIDGDRIAGKKTLAVRFGARFARLEFLFSIVIACLIPAYLFTIYNSGIYSLAALLVLPMAMPSIKIVLSGQSGKILNDVLARTGQLLILYSVLFSIGWLL